MYDIDMDGFADYYFARKIKPGCNKLLHLKVGQCVEFLHRSSVTIPVEGSWVIRNVLHYVFDGVLTRVYALDMDCSADSSDLAQTNKDVSGRIYLHVSNTYLATYASISLHLTNDELHSLFNVNELLSSMSGSGEVLRRNSVVPDKLSCWTAASYGELLSIRGALLAVDMVKKIEKDSTCTKEVTDNLDYLSLHASNNVHALEFEIRDGAGDSGTVALDKISIYATVIVPYDIILLKK